MIGVPVPAPGTSLNVRWLIRKVSTCHLACVCWTGRRPRTGASRQPSLLVLNPSVSFGDGLSWASRVHTAGIATTTQISKPLQLVVR